MTNAQVTQTGQVIGERFRIEVFPIRKWDKPTEIEWRADLVAQEFDYHSIGDTPEHALACLAEFWRQQTTKEQSE